MSVGGVAGCALGTGLVSHLCLSAQGSLDRLWTLLTLKYKLELMHSLIAITSWFKPFYPSSHHVTCPGIFLTSYIFTHAFNGLLSFWCKATLGLASSSSHPSFLFAPCSPSYCFPHSAFSFSWYLTAGNEQTKPKRCLRQMNCEHYSSWSNGASKIVPLVYCKDLYQTSLVRQGHLSKFECIEICS